MTSHPLVRMISFTGSVATGKKIAATAATDLKRVLLELGGNDPAIVLDDADVDSVADGLFAKCVRELRSDLRRHQEGLRADGYLRPARRRPS